MTIPSAALQDDDIDDEQLVETIVNQPNNHQIDGDSSISPSEEAEEDDALPLPLPLLREADQDYTLPMGFRDDGDSSSSSHDDEENSRAAPQASCSILIQAHLVEEEDCSAAVRQTTRTTVVSNESNATTENEEEDEETGGGVEVVMVVDAKPWKEFGMFTSFSRQIYAVLGFVALFILGVVLVKVFMSRKNRNLGNDVVLPSQDNDASSKNSAAPVAKTMSTPPQDEKESKETIMQYTVSPTAATKYSSESSLSTSTADFFVPPPSLSPVNSDPSRLARFEERFLSILPESTQAAIADDRASPQGLGFEYISNIVTGFPQVPAETTLREMFAIKMIHISTNGEKWFGYCTIPKIKTHSFDICIVPSFHCDASRQSFVSLNVSGHGVEGHLPPEIGLLSRLESLEMAHNPVGESLPTELGLLRHLELLDLSFDQFEGPLPSSLLSSSNSLTTVRLHHNRFNGTLLPEWADLNRTLETLTLHSNDFQGTIPDTWSHLTRLRELTLHDNPRLQGRVPEGLCARVRSGQLNLTVDCTLVSCETCQCHCATAAAT